MNFPSLSTKKNKTFVKNPLEVDAAVARAYSERRPAPPAPEQKPQPRTEFTIFSQVHHAETVENAKKVDTLLAQVKEQVDVIQNYNKSIQSEIKDIEKVLITGVAEGNKKGSYIENILEVFLFVLRNLTSKLGEAKTWLSAMETKKAKRGSAFAARSKKKGTAYSMSQELSNARSVQ